jgi:hypothetical protein
MKKTYFVLYLLLLPFFSIAQNDGEILKDFKKNSRNMVTQFQWDEHTWIFETNIDDNHFEIDAINDQMEIVWTAQLEGYVHYLGKFKGKVLTIASTEYKVFTSYNSTFKATLLDFKDGSTSVEKVIYDGPAETGAKVYGSQASDGGFFRFAIQQTGAERRAHISIAPLAVFAINKMRDQSYQTKDLTIIDLDENLQTIKTVKPTIVDGVLFDVNFDAKGAAIFSWIKEKNLTFTKYEIGKSSASATIEHAFEYKGGINKDPSYFFKSCMSKTNTDVLFYSIYCKNEDGDLQLNVSKVDFSKNKVQTVADVFTKKHISELEKAFVPVNKKLDKPDLGSVNDFQVLNIKEKDGKVVVGLMGTRAYSGSQPGVVKFFADAVMFNIYDMDLKPLYTALFPNKDSNFKIADPGFTIKNNVLYVIGNVSSGMRTNTALYGEYDMNEGVWNKMDMLGKKELGGPPHVSGKDAMWFSDGFIVPYFDRNTVLMGRESENFHLQHITN